MTPQLYTASWPALWRAAQAGRLDVQPVRISRGAPKFWPQAEGFPAIELVMPDGWMFGIPENQPERFRRAYMGKLDAGGVDAVRAALAAVAGDRPLALACFERDRSDCHRSDLAAWWLERTGETISEWAPQKAQLTLEAEADVRAVLREAARDALRARRAAKAAHDDKQQTAPAAEGPPGRTTAHGGKP